MDPRQEFINYSQRLACPEVKADEKQDEDEGKGKRQQRTAQGGRLQLRFDASDYSDPRDRFIAMSEAVARGDSVFADLDDGPVGQSEVVDGNDPRENFLNYQKRLNESHENKGR